MSDDGRPGAIAGFVAAFNAQDLDRFVATLSPGVEIQGGRGLIRGRAEAREWATRRPTGELRQCLILDRVRTDGHPTVALVRRQWRWRGNDELADEQRLAVHVAFDDDGLIARWQPFDDPAAGLTAAGIGERRPGAR